MFIILRGVLTVCTLDYGKRECYIIWFDLLIYI